MGKNLMYLGCRMEAIWLGCVNKRKRNRRGVGKSKPIGQIKKLNFILRVMGEPLMVLEHKSNRCRLHSDTPIDS